jgi:hypothetical protein
MLKFENRGKLEDLDLPGLSNLEILSEPNIRFIELFSFRTIYLLHTGGIRSPNFLIRNR